METPLEKYIKRVFNERKKAKKEWKELEKHATNLPSGGHMWTGADLIRYFEARKKRKKK